MKPGTQLNEEVGVLMGKQHYMTRDERYQLEAMHRNKIPVAEIARQLGFSRQTIYNELKRGMYLHSTYFEDQPRYSADKGQQIHQYNQTAKGRPLKSVMITPMLRSWNVRSGTTIFHLQQLWQRPGARAFLHLSAYPPSTATSTSGYFWS